MANDLDQIVDNLKQSDSWLRVLFMIGFAFLLYVIIAPVIFILMLVQALFVLLTGELNANLRYFGAAMAQYVLQILHFISYNSEEKPFPFSDFPAGESEETAETSETANAGEPEASRAAKPARRKTAKKKKSASRKSVSDKAPGVSDPEKGDAG